ncbi:acyltransferase family protein [Streptomyces sp. BA2]|uniref:acyltransferase family protein n=1 Tax=Streptomyces sp. BA2 TaxID=436595 RepID=UPI00132A9773|nr:acyltransferase [Streptomyces sp. BA2]MWA08544.1 acyltransferase family protein [Streptomyces sp. BA2]
MRSSNRQYLVSVDHLRAYAAVLVLLCHGTHMISPYLRETPNSDAHGWLYSENPLATLVLEGHSGVALFMVLSGFIFTIGALGKDVHYGRFLGNRVLRIFPLYIALIILGIGAHKQGADLSAVLQSLVGLGNLPGSLDLGAVSSMWWAIAVELQFYLLFPLFSRLLTKRGPVALFKLLAAIAVIRALVWASANGTISVNSMLYYSLAGRIDQFLLGMVAAWFFVHHRERFQGLLKVAVPTALATGAIWAFNQTHAFHERQATRLLWVDVEGALWALVVLTYVATISSTGIVSRGIAKVGEMSFSVYLLHYMVITAIVSRRWWFELTGRPVVDAFITAAVAVLPITLATAVVTFHGIERPFLRWRRAYLLTDPPKPAALPPAPKAAVVSPR